MRALGSTELAGGVARWHDGDDFSVGGEACRWIAGDVLS